MKLAKSEGKFELAPEETLKAVVVDVIDEGMKPGFDKVTLEQKVKIVFQTEEETTEGTPFLLRTFDMNASINKSSNLYKNYIRPILGRDLEEADFDSEGEIDLDELLIGKNVNVTVVHTEKGDKTYANINMVSPLSSKEKKEKPLEPRNYIRKKDREDDEGGPFTYGDTEDRV